MLDGTDESVGGPGSSDARQELVSAVVDALESGLVVGIPTDTVYGLAASVDHPEAVAALFSLKGRPDGVPVAVLVADPGGAWTVGEPNTLARRLAAAHWPGGLTLVLEADRSVSSIVGSNDGSVGVRCPDQPLIRGVAGAIGPIATTSANLHGQATPSTADGVAGTFPELALVVDGGSCPGAPSTVVDARGTEAVVLRRGGVRIGDARTPN